MRRVGRTHAEIFMCVFMNILLAFIIMRVPGRIQGFLGAFAVITCKTSRSEGAGNYKPGAEASGAANEAGAAELGLSRVLRWETSHITIKQPHGGKNPPTDTQEQSAASQSQSCQIKVKILILIIF